MNPVLEEGFELFKEHKTQVVHLERGRWTRYRYIAIHPTNPDYVVVLNLTTKHPEDLFIPWIMNGKDWALSPSNEELFNYAIDYHKDKVAYYEDMLKKELEMLKKEN